MTNKIRNLFAVILVNGAILFVLVEVLALSANFFYKGELFYTHLPNYPLIAETERGELTKERLLHPFLG